MAASCSSVVLTKPVELGFVEKRTAWKLRSKFFPSKVGGQPAWLNLKELPNTSELECAVCKKPCVFLLQVYAPFESEENFHRTIFIFMCKNGKCCQQNNSQNFVILRNQLPRKNEFYSFEPPIGKEKDSNIPSAEQNVKLCDICGCSGPLTCTGCRLRNYCGEEHQRIDWLEEHKNSCSSEKQENSKSSKKKTSSFLLCEYDLVMDSEYIAPEPPERSEQERMREYHKFMSAKAWDTNDNTTNKDIDSIAKKTDKVFRKFQKRIDYEPEQVLRYHRHEEPLWVSSENIPSEKDIPRCQCGAQRLFEFQVMPQLLNYLSVDAEKDSVDWGTLIAYTCANSCSLGNSGYVREVLWKQDYSEE